MKIKVQSGEAAVVEKIKKLFPAIPEDKTISKKGLTEKEVEVAIRIYSNIVLLHKFLKIFIIIHLVIIFFGWATAIVPFLYRSALTKILAAVKENGYIVLKDHVDTLKKWKRISLFYGTFTVKGLSTIIVKDAKTLVPKVKKTPEIEKG